MHAELAREIEESLAALTTPVDAGAPVQAGIGVVTVGESMRYRAFWLRAGGRREFFGPEFSYPREAGAFAREVNLRSGIYVSPWLVGVAEGAG